MEVKVFVQKSFEDDKEQGYSKKWKDGDLEEFFKLEGKYLDTLSGVANKLGKKDEGFIVTYTVVVKK